MAERRMFAKVIVDTDAFLDMPLSTQALYFHLGIRADDEGFVSNPKRIQRLIGAADDDLRLLISKRFVLAFRSGVIVIKHWRISNTLRKERIKPTLYQEEKSTLYLKSDGAYTDHPVDVVPELPPEGDKCLPECRQDVNQMSSECLHNDDKMSQQDKLSKDKLSKDKLDEGNKEKDRVVGEGKETPQSAATVSPFPYGEYRKIFCDNCPSLPKPQETANWTEARKKALRSKKVSQEEFRDVCKKIERSDFLTGRSGTWAGCSLDWILKPANWQKILEGNYDNRRDQSRTNSAMDDLRQLHEMFGDDP